MAFSAGRLGSPVWRSCNALRWPMDLATSRRDDRAQGETELTVVDESGLSSQRATESFGNEQRRLKPDSGCFGGPPVSNKPLRSSIAWMALWSVTSVPGRSGCSHGPRAGVFVSGLPLLFSDSLAIQTIKTRRDSLDSTRRFAFRNWRPNCIPGKQIQHFTAASRISFDLSGYTRRAGERFQSGNAKLPSTRQSGKNIYDFSSEPLDQINAGKYLMRRQKFDDAIAMFELSTTFPLGPPDRSYAYELIADCWLKQGNPAITAFYYERAIETDPTNKNARGKLDGLKASGQ
jgi:hypothetical protein